mgnify:CR=1 FL=1
MKFGLWTQYGALNSKPIFAALEKGITSLGHTVGYNTDDCDIPVISVSYTHLTLPTRDLV